MDLGFHLPIFDIDGGTTAIAGELARVGAAVEAAGVNWLSFMDHFFQIEPTGLPAEAHMLEGYTTLGYLAAHTSTVKLGLLVTGVTYRHPGLLAKDRLLSTCSPEAGRAWASEWHFSSVSIVALESQQRALRGNALPTGQTLCSPQPIRSPSVLIGGGGERKPCALLRNTAMLSPARWIDGMAPAISLLADRGCIRACTSLVTNPYVMKKSSSMPSVAYSRSRSPAR